MYYFGQIYQYIWVHLHWIWDQVWIECIIHALWLKMGQQLVYFGVPVFHVFGRYHRLKWNN